MDCCSYAPRLWDFLVRGAKALWINSMPANIWNYPSALWESIVRIRASNQKFKTSLLRIIRMRLPHEEHENWCESRNVCSATTIETRYSRGGLKKNLLEYQEVFTPIIQLCGRSWESPCSTKNMPHGRLEKFGSFRTFNNLPVSWLLRKTHVRTHPSPITVKSMTFSLMFRQHTGSHSCQFSIHDMNRLETITSNQQEFFLILTGEYVPYAGSS